MAQGHRGRKSRLAGDALDGVVGGFQQHPRAVDALMPQPSLRAGGGPIPEPAGSIGSSSPARAR
jgi:hypothetical protein